MSSDHGNTRNAIITSRYRNGTLIDTSDFLRRFVDACMPLLGTIGALWQFTITVDCVKMWSIQITYHLLCRSLQRVQAIGWRFEPPLFASSAFTSSISSALLLLYWLSNIWSELESSVGC